MTPKIALIHALNTHSRTTNLDFTLSFIRYVAACDWTAINALGPISSHLRNQRFDLVLVTYDFLALRESSHWRLLLSRVTPILELAERIALLPQDDYTRSASLDSFINRFDVDHVFTPVRFDLGKIYPKSVAAGRDFTTVLTGYFEPQHVEEWAFGRKPFDEREIDLGQRVRRLPPYFGPEANEKSELAGAFASVAARAGFICDVSFDENAALIGPDWITFLGNSRFTVGHLGGATVVDPRGDLRRVDECLKRGAWGLKYLDAAQQLSVSGSLAGNFRAISPRLFEASIMGVCQVMPEADYQIGFEPWEHYLPVSPDLANVNSTLEAMRDLEFCERIARQSLQYIEQHENLTYSHFASTVINTMLAPVRPLLTSNNTLKDSALPFVLLDPEWPSLLPKVQTEVKHAWASGRTKFLSNSLCSSLGRWKRDLLQPELFERDDLREVLAAWMAGVSAGELSLTSVYTQWIPAIWFLQADRAGGSPGPVY